VILKNKRCSVYANNANGNDNANSKSIYFLLETSMKQKIALMKRILKQMKTNYLRLILKSKM